MGRPRRSPPLPQESAAAGADPLQVPQPRDASVPELDDLLVEVNEPEPIDHSDEAMVEVDETETEAASSVAFLGFVLWFDAVESGIAELKVGIAKLEARITELESGVARSVERFEALETAKHPGIAPVGDDTGSETALPDPSWRDDAIDGRLAPATPTRPSTWQTRSPWAQLRQALGFVVAGGLLILAFVVMLRPVIGQYDAPLTGPEETFAPPVAVPADGSYVETVVLNLSGDLQVTHWIRSTVPLLSITLTMPELRGLQAGHAVATEVQVAADGQVVAGADTVDNVNQSYEFSPARAVYVAYVLTGVVERSTSVDGRALARITSLDVSYASDDGTSTRSIEGVDVLALACSPATDPFAAPEPCGSPKHGRWQVELSGEDRDDRVMAQLDFS